MSPVRFVPREEWEAELRYYGCEPLAGKGKLNTAEWWRMPFQAYPFTVPCEADGRMPQSALEDRVLKILAAAPDDWIPPGAA